MGAYVEVEKVQGRVDTDDGNLGAAVLVGDGVQGVEDCLGGGDEHAAGNGKVRHIQYKDIDQGLRRADHVLARGHVLDDTIGDFGALEAVYSLLRLGVKIKIARD